MKILSLIRRAFSPDPMALACGLTIERTWSGGYRYSGQPTYAATPTHSGRRAIAAPSSPEIEPSRGAESETFHLEAAARDAAKGNSAPTLLSAVEAAFSLWSDHADKVPEIPADVRSAANRVAARNEWIADAASQYAGTKASRTSESGGSNV